MEKRVNAKIFEEVKNYICNSDFCDPKCDIYTNPHFIEIAREYYDKQLPVDLETWAMLNAPGEPFNDASKEQALRFNKQVEFVSEKLNPILFDSYEELSQNPVKVIASYKDLGLKCPVYYIVLKKHNVEFTFICGNDGGSPYILSVKADRKLEVPGISFYDSGDDIHWRDAYTGTPKLKIYKSYKTDSSEFTINVSDEYEFYTVMFLIKNHLRSRDEK